MSESRTREAFDATIERFASDPAAQFIDLAQAMVELRRASVEDRIATEANTNSDALMSELAAVDRLLDLTKRLVIDVKSGQSDEFIAVMNFAAMIEGVAIAFKEDTKAAYAAAQSTSRIRDLYRGLSGVVADAASARRAFGKGR